jgi:MFS family permease
MNGPLDAVAPATGQSFSHRVFLAGQATSLLGEGLSILAVPLLVLQITRSPIASALAAAPRTIGYLVAGLPAGPIIDRLNPWTVLITTDIVRAAVFLTLYLLTITTTVPAWVIIMLAALAGAAAVFFDTALAVTVQDVFTGPRLIRANSLLETATQASLVLGPALVGALAVTAGIEVGLLVTSFTFLVSLMTLFTVSGRQRSRTGRPSATRTSWRKVGHEFTEGLAYLRATRIILALTIVQAVINLCLAVEKLVIFFATQTLAAAAFWSGIVVAAGGAGGVLGAITAPPVTARLGQMRVVVLSVALIGVTLAAMGPATSVWWLAAANLVLVWATVLPSVVIRTMRQQIVPRALLGRVTSTARVIFLAVTPIGAVLASAVTDLAHDSPRPAFVGAGAIILLTVAIAWNRELHRYQQDTPITSGVPAPPSDNTS